MYIYQSNFQALFSVFQNHMIATPLSYTHKRVMYLKTNLRQRCAYSVVATVSIINSLYTTFYVRVCVPFISLHDDDGEREGDGRVSCSNGSSSNSKTMNPFSRLETTSTFTCERLEGKITRAMT